MGPGVGGPGGLFSADQSSAPNLTILDRSGNRIWRPHRQADGRRGGFQRDGPAIGLAFENGFKGGRLFASDSNQGVRGGRGQPGQHSRLLTIDLQRRQVNPFISGRPPEITRRSRSSSGTRWIYWSQGSATNSAVSRARQRGRRPTSTRSRARHHAEQQPLPGEPWGPSRADQWLLEPNVHDPAPS